MLPDWKVGLVQEPFGLKQLAKQLAELELLKNLKQAWQELQLELMMEQLPSRTIEEE